MSAETIETLNTLQLIGFTDKRGKAWHYRADAQGAEPNHYPGPIPIEDVNRRLFGGWNAVVRGVWTEVPCTLDETFEPGFVGFIADDGQPTRLVYRPKQQAVCASDDNTLFHIFDGGWAPHQYSEWLLDNVANILDDGLAIGSAGLLQERGRAYVQVEVPDTITTPEGVSFRPNLTAATAHNGKMSTIYKRMVTVVVCDNTLGIGLREKGQEYKIRHTRNSGLHIASAREALNVIHKAGDDFAAEVKALCEQTVTTDQWNRLLDSYFKAPEGATKNTVSIRERKREELQHLYDWDTRVTPWRGTAFGVLQAFNTHDAHVSTVKGAKGNPGKRAERNMINALSDVTETRDAAVLRNLNKIQNRDLVAA